MTAKEFNIGQASSVDGLMTLRSAFGPEETMTRLVAEIKARGIREFARINHASLAAETGLALLPTELLIFGNPAAGTPLMQSNQAIGLDLPLKALVWQDVNNETWLAYNDINWLAERYGVGLAAEKTFKSMTVALDAIAKKAAGLSS
jgi:uncharacterized protein (DUF302 family)